ncbi:integrase core domain-containing protein [Bradyrhizobium sp. CCBAU 51753]|uniref:integrase core domain-containing protein n=1 Tax=Bradyrhizobium sp. CCBAU 51753 TaxID=1325100 RepID=UPI0035301B96
MIVSNNGAEFQAEWHHIALGSPPQRALIESFNRRPCDELISERRSALSCTPARSCRSGMTSTTPSDRSAAR